MKRALITGINGMDGSHLADFLLEKGYVKKKVSIRDSRQKIYEISKLINSDLQQ